VGGYWRNWERFAAFPMRELAYVNIAGNPNIRHSDKPKSSRDFMRLSIDGEKKIERPTEEEIEQARKDIFYGKAKT
jgi:hypothetical protein